MKIWVKEKTLKPLTPHSHSTPLNVNCWKISYNVKFDISYALRLMLLFRVRWKFDIHQKIKLKYTFLLLHYGIINLHIQQNIYLFKKYKIKFLENLHISWTFFYFFFFKTFQSFFYVDYCNFFSLHFTQHNATLLISTI